MLAGKGMPENWRQRLDELWKKLLFNQFHDIAPGTSIARVHERAEKELQEVAENAWDWIGSLVDPDNAVPEYIYNHFSWNLSNCPAQTCTLFGGSAPAQKATVSHTYEGWILENPYLRCIIDENGELVSVKRPGCDTEYMAGNGNRFLLFKDVNTCYDAWEIGSMYEKMPVHIEASTTIRGEQVLTTAILEIEKTIGTSLLKQTILLRSDAKRLEFYSDMDWQEKHKMLKVAFPIKAYANEAYHEIQFGYVKRPVHRSYQTDKDRYEVCNHRYTAFTDGAHGAAVLNDGKYGVNVVENEIRLTLLRAPMMPDQTADRGKQELNYAFYPFDGAFQDSDVVHQAADFNEKPIFAGIADDLGSIFLPDAKNIIVDTIKPADVHENALLVRVYEAMGKQTDCAFTANPKIKDITETDMLEENPTPVDISHVHFGPFEIKTFILYL
jgi:alpha-mannosidase